MKFEELLAKYGVTAEEVTFEIEGLSDEELEAKFQEAFEGDDEPVVENEEQSEANNDGNEEPEPDDEGGDDVDGDNAENVDGDGDDGEGTDEGENTFESRKSYSTDDNGNVTIIFEISHEDIRGALNTLISVYDEEDNDWYWVTKVYDDYFIFENWMGDKLYKQYYAVDGDNVTLSGDRQEMFKMILTESEKLAIEKMREDYSTLEGKYNELKEFKDNYDATELHNQREAVLAAEEYSILAENEEFKALVADMDKFSVDELKVQADLVFASHVKTVGEFSIKNEEVQKPKSVGFNFKAKKTEKKGPYGNLFSNSK